MVSSAHWGMNMRMLVLKWIAVAILTASLGGCAIGPDQGVWTVLVDGIRGLDNFDRVGTADWVASDDAIQATQGGKTAAYLVSKQSYGDFTIRVEFWASADANSGVFLRCQDRSRITSDSCYEANIFDQAKDPAYGTGAMVKVAPVELPMPVAGDKWNTYEITLRGSHLVVVLNGRKTVDVFNSKLSSGPIALQWSRGTIRFRKVEIKNI